MPEILVLRQPEDKVYDRVPVTENALGSKVEELYQKLGNSYTLEVLPDGSPRTQS